MSSAISNDVQQLTQLSEEIKRRQKELSKLRKTKQECEERIINYLNANNQPGIKYKGKTIIAEEKSTRKPIKKADKVSRGTEILQRNGITNTKETLDELLEAMRGSPKPKPAIRIL
jgi:hypothetical protein